MTLTQCTVLVYIYNNNTKNRRTSLKEKKEKKNNSTLTSNAYNHIENKVDRLLNYFILLRSFNAIFIK